MLASSRQLAASSDVLPQIIEPPKVFQSASLYCETSVAKHAMSRNVVTKSSPGLILSKRKRHVPPHNGGYPHYVGTGPGSLSFWILRISRYSHLCLRVPGTTHDNHLIVDREPPCKVFVFCLVCLVVLFFFCVWSWSGA